MNVSLNNKLWYLALILGTAYNSNALGSEAESKHPTQDKDEPDPNILVFVADDAGMDYGCYGNSVIQTPNIDKLAEEGVRFENAFLTASQSSPSRTSMLTGQFAHTIGTGDLHVTQIDDTVKTLPGTLRKEGYYTGYMLKGHFGSHIDEDFHWYDEGFWPDYIKKGTWYDKALGNFQRFLDKSGENPFFMWVGFVDPHRPYGPNESVEGNRAPEVHNPEKIKEVPPYLVNNKETRRDLARYYDEIHRMDGQIGNFIEELEKRGLKDNTVIIFLSDNGYPFPRGKATVYDDGIQTPFIASWKGHIPENTTHKGLESTIDLAPTLLDIAGGDVPDQMYGSSMLPVLKDPEKEGRKYIFAERNWHSTDAHMRCIRSKKYKLIFNGYPNRQFPIIADFPGVGSYESLLEAKANDNLSNEQDWLFEFPRPSIELYNVQKDPYETNNLAADRSLYETTGKKLNQKLFEWMEATDDYPPNEKRRHDEIDRKTGFHYNNDFYGEYWEE